MRTYRMRALAAIAVEDRGHAIGLHADVGGPDEIDYKVNPWWVSDSSDWLTADADGEMLLMTGAFGVSYTDDWIDGFQGANVAYADDDKTSGWWQDGDGLLGGLTCLTSDTYANIGEPVPAIPHAQYYAETGKAHAVPLDAIEDALDSGTADDFVGIVWHPMGYDLVPAGSVPIGANRIDALLDALDIRGIASATVSETVAGATAAC